eukprot:TRINITY_DN5955_c0_g1_i1.p5 TRINITY_DN5955_c0_g1~~TRINITY_DN5955_c0_g1_i1.p5  ORF type:complete len:134 (-),score=3.24 TRINITY_DN5955_c0_g1_i1:814-1215(-)
MNTYQMINNLGVQFCFFWIKEVRTVGEMKIGSSYVLDQRGQQNKQCGEKFVGTMKCCPDLQLFRVERQYQTSFGEICYPYLIRNVTNFFCFKTLQKRSKICIIQEKVGNAADNLKCLLLFCVLKRVSTFQIFI